MSQPNEEIETQWSNVGFNQRFEQVLKGQPDLPYTQVYLKVEHEHIEKFGKCRYKSYDSFRQSRKILIFGR